MMLASEYDDEILIADAVEAQPNGLAIFVCDVNIFRIY